MRRVRDGLEIGEVITFACRTASKDRLRRQVALEEPGAGCGTQPLQQAHRTGRLYEVRENCNAARIDHFVDVNKMEQERIERMTKPTEIDAPRTHIAWLDAFGKHALYDEPNMREVAFDMLKHSEKLEEECAKYKNEIERLLKADETITDGHYWFHQRGLEVGKKLKAEKEYDTLERYAALIVKQRDELIAEVGRYRAVLELIDDPKNSFISATAKAIAYEALKAIAYEALAVSGKERR